MDLEVVVDSADPAKVKYVMQRVQHATGIEVDSFYQAFYKNLDGLKNYGSGSGVGVFSISPNGATQNFFAAWFYY